MKDNRKNQKKHIPVIGIAGWSGSGKTTLLVNLIPAIREIACENGKKEFRMAVIKHDAHGITLTPVSDPESGMDTAMYMDTEGKDSWKFRKAGADKVILCGPEGMFISAQTCIMKRIMFSAHSGTPMLDAAIQMACDCDLILVEGFKNGSLPRIGIARKENGKGLTADPGRFLAVVTDDPDIEEKCRRADSDQSTLVFRLDQYRELAGFLWQRKPGIDI